MSLNCSNFTLGELSLIGVGTVATSRKPPPPPGDVGSWLADTRWGMIQREPVLTNLSQLLFDRQRQHIRQYIYLAKPYWCRLFTYHVHESTYSMKSNNGRREHTHTKIRTPTSTHTRTNKHKETHAGPLTDKLTDDIYTWLPFSYMGQKCGWDYSRPGVRVTIT